MPRVLWITSATPNGPPEWSIEVASDGEEGIEKLRTSSFDVIVIETPVSQSSPEELIEELAREQTGTPILVQDAGAGVQDVVRYMRLGAHDVAAGDAGLVAIVESAVEFGRCRGGATGCEEPWRKFLVGSSRAMLRTKE